MFEKFIKIYYADQLSIFQTVHEHIYPERESLTLLNLHYRIKNIFENVICYERRDLKKKRKNRRKHKYLLQQMPVKKSSSIGDKPSLIFLHTPKCGGSSIIATIAEFYNGNIVGNQLAIYNIFSLPWEKIMSLKIYLLLIRYRFKHQKYIPFIWDIIPQNAASGPYFNSINRIYDVLHYNGFAHLHLFLPTMQSNCSIVIKNIREIRENNIFVFAMTREPVSYLLSLYNFFKYHFRTSSDLSVSNEIKNLFLSKNFSKFIRQPEIHNQQIKFLLGIPLFSNWDSSIYSDEIQHIFESIEKDLLIMGVLNRFSESIQYFNELLSYTVFEESKWANKSKFSFLTTKQINLMDKKYISDTYTFDSKLFELSNSKLSFQSQ